MLLHHKLKDAGWNISGVFTVKWQTVQECLYNAISDEQGVSRMTNFLALNHTKFSEALLELLVNMVDREVDAFLEKPAMYSKTQRKDSIASSPTAY